MFNPIKSSDPTQFSVGDLLEFDDGQGGTAHGAVAEVFSNRSDGRNTLAEMSDIPLNSWLDAGKLLDSFPCPTEERILAVLDDDGELYIAGTRKE